MVRNPDNYILRGESSLLLVLPLGEKKDLNQICTAQIWCKNVFP